MKDDLSIFIIFFFLMTTLLLGSMRDSISTIAKTLKDAQQITIQIKQKD